MKKFISIASLFLILSKNGNGQATNCGQAVNQLQSYAAQINRFYYNEYWTVIPNVRCPAYDQWGRPFNPVMVQNCRNQTLWYLNQWYGQQCNYVNNWYAQIVRGCSVQTPPIIRKPAPRPKQNGEENTQIDTDEIQDLTAGIDEEKALKISIPKTASGFRPKN